MADETTKTLDYSRLPIPTPPRELDPSWVLSLLWAGLAIGGVLLTGIAWCTRYFW
jgi:hypothetical protein